MKATTLFTATSCAVVLAYQAALGAIETDDPKATLQLPVAGAGQAVGAGSFSMLAWVRPHSLPARDSFDDALVEANILQIDGCLTIQLLSDGSFRARLIGQDSSELVAHTKSVFKLRHPEQWALVAISFDHAEGTLSLWARSESSELQSALAALPGFTVASIGSFVHVGAVDDVPAMLGFYGLIALRDHAISAADVSGLWDHRRHHGPYSYTNTATGGSMNGPDGCVWMINHSMTTRPINAGAGGEPHEWSAVVDEPVTRFNVHVYDITGAQGTSYRSVRAVAATEGFIHRSPYDPPPFKAASPDERFFERTLPQVTDTFPDPPYYVSRISPKARLLASPLPSGIGLVRVMASANSRGIQPGDGSETGTGNFAHGLLWNNLERTAGVLNRPARAAIAPWFGFDASHHEPHTEGDITELRFTDFSRFWTSAHHTSSIGPGEGVLLKPGGAFIMRCRPQGMIEAGQPLLVQAHVLKFPGASSVQFVPNKHTQQGEQGTNVGSVMEMSLDTQTWSHTVDAGAGDAIISATRIELAGDHRMNANVGDACFAGEGSLSVIASVTYDGVKTTLDFQHPFSVLPGDGSVLRFGPWELATVWHRWPGLDAGDSEVWRGLRISAGSGHGVVLFSFDAWRPGVDGFAFAGAGWGGMGYEQQINRAFAGSTSAWAARLNIDIWLVMFATQLSHPNTLDAYTAHVRGGIPGVEVVWLGDIEHPSSWDHETWHWWAIDRADENQVVANTLLVHPDLGSQLDLFGDGIRSDVLHTSQRGNQRLATLWTQVLQDAALPGPLPKLGDLNGDGVVDVTDLLLFLGTWGACDNVNTCAGDFDDDGIVDVSDILRLLSNWG